MFLLLVIFGVLLVGNLGGGFVSCQAQTSVSQNVIAPIAQNKSPEVVVATNNSNNNNSFQATNAANVSNEDLKYNQFLQSKYYTPLYEPNLKKIPDAQVELNRLAIHNNFVYFKKILAEAIEKRDQLTTGVALPLKYAPKLIALILGDLKKEHKLKDRHHEKPEYFAMLADWIQGIIKKSASLKNEKAYHKNNINYTDLGQRFNETLDYVEQTVQLSPVASYLMWPNVTLFKGEPAKQRDLGVELTDILAVSIHQSVENITDMVVHQYEHI